MFFLEKALKIVQKAVTFSQFLPSNVCSAIPSLIFFISSFILLCQHFRIGQTKWTRVIRVSQNFRRKIIIFFLKNTRLQRIYLILTLLWYIFLSYFRTLIAFAEYNVMTYLDEQEMSLIVTYGAATIFVTSLAIFPVFLIFVNYWATCKMEELSKK